MTQKSLHWLDEVDSTNTYISQMYDKGHLSSQNQTLYTVATLNQRLGVGRRGTRWIDSPGCSLAFSTFILVSTELIRFVPMLASLAVYNSLQTSISPQGLSIKWPNDVLLQGKKLCGVMGKALHTHTSTAPLSSSLYTRDRPSLFSPICVGIGINMFTPTHLLPTPDSASLLSHASYFLHQSHLSRRMPEGKITENAKIDICNFFIRRFQVEFARLFLEREDSTSSKPAFFCTPKDSFLKDYKAACSTIGKKIKFLISAENKTLTGIATDIDPLGSIEIQSGGEKFVFDSAQISKVQIYV